jgi:fructose/tagatose bisphosphate aldolase
MNYKKYIFSYGIISVLIVLQELERRENFEECQKIIDTIKELNGVLEMELPTVITPESIEEVIKTYLEFNIKTNSDKVLQTSIYFAQLIIEEIL